MASLAGTCGKCGAPYFYTDEAYGGDVPPPVRPTCNCWNITSKFDVTTVEPATWTWTTSKPVPCEHCMCKIFEATTGCTAGVSCCRCGHTVHTGGMC